MKFCLLICLMGVLSPAFSQTGSDDSGEDYFDPERDPIAVEVNGRVRLVLSEELIVRSVTATLPRVGAIEHIDRKEYENHWYLTIESRHADDMEQSVFVAIRLVPDGKGNYFADHYWTTCTGSGCGSCGYAGYQKGCFCLFDKPGEPGVPGSCYQTFSNDPLMVKVPRQQPR